VAEAHEDMRFSRDVGGGIVGRGESKQAGRSPRVGSGTARSSPVVDRQSALLRLDVAAVVAV
jgi:hypothetical protein